MFEAALKPQPQDLAIFGGPPTFVEPLHVGRPNVGSREHLLKRINDMLNRNWLTNDGPFVREFEKRIARFVGVRHCIAMCNGTVSLEIAIRALGLTGEVIVPSFSFIATPHALQWQLCRRVMLRPAGTAVNRDPVSQVCRTIGIAVAHAAGVKAQLAKTH
jgi:dTDP-4-amino-4,6-dideoxygalactose transaminase